MSEGTLPSRSNERTTANTTRSNGMDHAHQHRARAQAPRAGRSTRDILAAAWRLTRHLLEMLAAMFVGMLLLGVAVRALGTPPGHDTLPGMYAYMAVAMAAPMVAWMRRRGHRWADCAEMTAAMVMPLFALVLPVALGWARSVPGLDADTLMPLAHGAMIGGMVILMACRRDRYAHGAHGHAAVAEPAAGDRWAASPGTPDR